MTLEDRQAQRREDILDASERIFAQKGYHATGIADIASALGLGHGTFYRYFKNKHDIALQVFDRLVARFAEIGLAEDPELSNSLVEYRAQVERIVHNWLLLADENPHMVRLFHEQASIIDASRLAFIVENYVQYTALYLKNGVRKGFLRSHLDVRATAEILVTLIFEGTRRALIMPKEARQRWAAAAVDFMFCGISR